MSEQNIGVAAGDLDGDRVVVSSAVQCGTRRAVDVICEFLGDAQYGLLALDAPLGWPEPLARTLLAHRAGAPLSGGGHALFRRRTDVVVKRETGQQPLDVGADRIARTALAALVLLEAIRDRMHAPIPLAWSPDGHGIRAIEVYPAATLRRLGIEPKSYKKREQAAARAAIVQRLASYADMSSILPMDAARADTVDAVVCVLAGADFLMTRCHPPSADERALVEHEGWIWFRA